MSNTVINPYNFAVGGAGGWVELDRTTLGSSNDSILVSGLSNKMYYMVLCDLKQVTSNIRSSTRLNADSATNYSNRDNENGGADSSATSQTYMKNSGSITYPCFNVQYFSNLLANEKLSITSNVGEHNSGASSAPTRMESVGKWANTSSVITSIEQYNDQPGSFDTGSEVVVLGYDPSDTHTSGGFWEELASVEWTSGSSIDSGTFTAKKYLWVQTMFNTGTMSGSYSGLQVGNATIDTGSSYAFRYSEDGAADSSQVNKTNAWGAVGIGSDSSTSINFSNHFIVNNASNEKLGISHSVINRGDAGSGFAPYRVECFWKWTDTSNQINRIEVSSQAGSGNYTGGAIKVWGHD